MSKTIYLEGIDGGTTFDAVPIPDNELGLQNGTTLKPTKGMPWFGLKCGQEFVINYDGEVVRAGGLSWSVEGLVTEINNGFWQVVNQVQPGTVPAKRKNEPEQISSSRN